MALTARAIAMGLAASLVASASVARADDTAEGRRAAAAREMGRPYTMAEADVGFLTLPAAEVCKTITNCSRGEASLALGVHFLYRDGPFGVGAGIEWATTLRNDAALGDPSLGREHSRRYFLVEGQGRYYPFRRGPWEWWVGAMAGGVIVNDSWSVLADRDPPSDADVEGPRSATLGTEGIAAGVGTGVEWVFLRNLSFGTQLRYSRWFLPTNPAMLPTGDVASLKGSVDMLELSFALAYRIAL